VEARALFEPMDVEEPRAHGALERSKPEVDVAVGGGEVAQDLRIQDPAPKTRVRLVEPLPLASGGVERRAETGSSPWRARCPAAICGSGRLVGARARATSLRGASRLPGAAIEKNANRTRAIA
jgi:hypothetical protein